MQQIRDVENSLDMYRADALRGGVRERPEANRRAIEAGKALRDEWAPVFTARREATFEVDMDAFDDYIIKAAPFGEWEWPRSGLATRRGRSAPGPGGVPHQPWGMGMQRSIVTLISSQTSWQQRACHRGIG